VISSARTDCGACSAPSLAAGRVVQIELGGTLRDARILSAGAHGRGLVLLALEDVADRSAAEALVGGRILVRAADLPPPEEDEFYYHEVAGFRVETTTGEPLGAIHETFTTGVNDVWVVQGEGREHLIPVIADVVRAIDRAHRRVVIEPMPGLLE
jgi:16S rRNA processing protein RimM